MRKLALRLGLKLTPRDEKSPLTVGPPHSAVFWVSGNNAEWDIGNDIKWS